MKAFIALFRGIDVGGRNKLPMKDLCTLMEYLGLKNVRNYIFSEVDAEPNTVHLTQQNEED
ncbi:DUF1697 domain-containing protein [Pseudomonadota bacterium]